MAMATGWGEVEGRGERHLHDWSETFPAPQRHRRTTREPVRDVSLLDAHPHTGVAAGREKEFSAVIVGTPGRVAPAMEGLVQLMQK